MPRKGYDFAGWVTKNDILCSDGVIIRKGAFVEETPKQVPLVWNHQHNDVTSVIGQIDLEHRDIGTYGYGYFSDTDQGRTAKQLVKDGIVNAMSIAASKIKRIGQNNENVVHGKIFEVSLVLTGANPGAKIEEVIAHSEYGEEMNFSIIHTDELIHTEENEDDEPELKEETPVNDAEKIYNSLNPEQRELFDALLDELPEDGGEQEVEPSTDVEVETGGTMRQSAFDSQVQQNESTLTHAELDNLLQQAIQGGVGKLSEFLMHNGISMKNVEMLFPDAALTTTEPQPIRNNNLGTDTILNGVGHQPATRFKSRYANMTEERARARGYIKRDQKLNSFIDFLERKAEPQTVYVKDEIDRDDVLDIKTFDIIVYRKKQLREDLRDELARAILVGDGRPREDRNKIREDRIRPIIKEPDFFKITMEVDNVQKLFSATVMAKKEYRGSGGYTAFIHPDLAASIRLLRKADNTFWNGTLPMTDAQLAAVLGAKDICETVLMPEKEMIMMNLKDYSIGMDKGGETTSFDGFDLDFNLHKFLLETRLSGMTEVPKSIIHIKVKALPEIEGVKLTTPGLGLDKFNEQEQAVQTEAATRDEIDQEYRDNIDHPSKDHLKPGFKPTKGGAQAAGPGQASGTEVHTG